MDIEDKNNILMKTNDAVITLQGVLEGKHDTEIDDTLNQHHIPREGWWSAFFRVVEGMAAMGRLAHNRPHPLEDDFEDKAIDWS
nr:ABC transporter C family member 1-like [Malus domestica]